MKLKFTIQPHKNIKMSFGIGMWSPMEVEKMTNKLESFEMISSTQRIKIDSLPLLRQFLLARRKGVGGSKIQIVAR